MAHRIAPRRHRSGSASAKVAGRKTGPWTFSLMTWTLWKRLSTALLPWYVNLLLFLDLGGRVTSNKSD